MKRSLCIVLLLAAGLARADDLGDANRLLQAGSVDQAFPIYQRLAQAGNPVAQLRLGEMYWFGEATAPDLARAAQWFERSARAGNADAAASLASLKRRAAHGDEIVYWTTRYQGEDLVSGQFACKRPAIPGLSMTKQEILAVQHRLDAWRDCYQRFAANINALTTAGKRIPSEVVDMMTPAEAQAAERHVDAVYAGVVAHARKDAAQVAVDEHAWLATTEDYVENGTDPSHGFIEFLRSASHPEDQTYLTSVNAARMAMRPQLAPTGVLH